MDISQISSITPASGTSPSRNIGSDLGKDEFMKILVAQLSNQDPLSPLEDKDFIAQMAQFSMLEELQNLDTGMAFSQASSLVGKFVCAQVATSDGQSRAVFGQVEAALIIDGAPCLQIDGETIPYNENIIVYQPTQTETPSGSTL